jgi:hypothetical protein
LSTIFLPPGPSLKGIQLLTIAKSIIAVKEEDKQLSKEKHL